MNGVSRIAVLAAAACVWTAAAGGQQKVAKPPNPAQLELTTEVAATTEEGYPSVLRVTIRNVGNVAVDMPMPASPCVGGGGGIGIHRVWTAASFDGFPGKGRGSGWGCGWSEMPTLMDRVRDEWIRLRPGEFVVFSDRITESREKLEPGTVEYWAEYIPPEAKPEELAELERAGYVVPTRKVESEHRIFAVH
jgi:hypothetical protein